MNQGLDVFFSVLIKWSLAAPSVIEVGFSLVVLLPNFFSDLVPTWIFQAYAENHFKKWHYDPQISFILFPSLTQRYLWHLITYTKGHSEDFPG